MVDVNQCRKRWREGGCKLQELKTKQEGICGCQKLGAEVGIKDVDIPICVYFC